MSVNTVKQDGSLQRIAGGTLYTDAPIGAIMPYGGTTAPSGWFLCQGQAVSRTTYAELFAVIGTAFGTGDGSTTFNIPDFRGEFLRGAGTNSHTGQGNGGAVGEHQDATTIMNTYGSTGTVIQQPLGYGIQNSDAGVAKSTEYVSATASSPVEGSFAAYSFKPTNTSVNYIIKAKQVALPTDFDGAVDEKIADNIVDSITNGSMKAVTSNAVYDAFKAKRGDYTLTIPTGWVSEAYLRRQNDTLYLTGNIYTTGTGIANGTRLIIENFFPSDCRPNSQSAYYLPVAPDYGDSLHNGVTCYVNGGRNLYLDNHSGITVKQIYFNIVALCA